ncbi:myb/SANT-like DNA-binding domain-containing protein 4 [Plutella xylostella]|uniref:myb/SANT-like DNA-binding domain-containing protein 4 n=1 Tax=Plutella xylostella TaxID=51655 RepID=UPI0020329E1E|nr:myb/SANT-like DNA-binding domain-containing protein 4 [Plutella xylostella]
MPAKKQITEAQERLLLQMMQENPEIANNRVTSLTDSMAKQNLQKFWESLASRLNATGSGNKRVWQKWRDYWTERKYGVRRKVAKIQAHTGSGSSAIKLTDVEEQILEIMDMKPTHLRESSAAQGYYNQEFVLECTPAMNRPQSPVSPAHSPLMESMQNTLHKSEIKSDPLQEQESQPSSPSNSPMRDELVTQAPSWAVELENRRMEIESQQLRVLERLATSVDKLATTADKLLQMLANK